MKRLLMMILPILCCLTVFAQHAGDSIDCSDRIGYSWMKSYGNSNSEFVSDVAVDGDGNIYVTGSFAGTLTMGSFSVTSAGNTDFYVAKMTPDGSVLWLKSGGSNVVERANAIDVDADGNVFVVGLSNDNTSFEGNAFPSKGAGDGFLLKLDTNGNFEFVRTFGSYQDDNAMDVAIDGDNNVFVTGFYNYMLQIGPTSFYQEGNGNDDPFLVKLNNSGEVLWSMPYGSTSQDYGRKVACDAANNVYLAGEFRGIMSIGGNYLVSQNDRNVFVVKFNSEGTVQWSTSMGAAGNDSVRALNVSRAGDVFFAYQKETSATPIIAKYSTSGSSTGTINYNGSGSMKVNDILCDSYGNTYVAGSFYGQIDFGAGSVTSNGTGSDFYIVRYGSDWTPNMQFYGNQANYNEVKALALDYANNVVAGGAFASSITLGGDTETSAGSNDALLIKYERYMSFGQTTVTNTACDANNMGVSIDVTGGVAPYSYYWSNGATGESMSGISSGTYNVTVVDQDHCYITTTVTLTPPQPPVVDIPNYLQICPSDSVTISANAGMAAYHWNTGATTRDIVVSDAGTYIVTITSTNSCTASASSTISKYPNLDVVPERDYYFCPGEFLTIEANGFLSYYWSNGSNSSTFTTPMEYTFWVRAYNGICYYYDTITTHKYPQPTIDLGSDKNFCEGDSIRVTAPGGFESYSWSNGASGNSIWVNNGCILRVNAYDANGCAAVDSINVNSVELPKVDLGPDSTYCTDGKVVLESSIPCEDCSYLWSNRESGPSIAVTQTGTYWIEVTNSYGCSNYDTVHINVIRIEPIGLPDAMSFCEDYATLSSANRYSVYEWSTGDNTPSIDIYDSGIYAVTVTDVNGCTTSDVVSATKHEIVEPYFGGDTVFCGLHTRRLYLNTTYSSYRWNNGTDNPYIDISNPGGHYSVSVTNAVGCTASTSMNASFSDIYPEIIKITSGKGLVVVDVEGGTPPYYYSADGENWQASNIFDNLPSDFYDIIVMDHNYCTDQMQTFLDASIGVPSFFTPNGDGFNDTWKITGLYMYPDSKVAVYDRFGKELFVSKGATCEWDGIYAGRPLPSDSYWYVITLGEGIVPQKGCVVLKR